MLWIGQGREREMLHHLHGAIVRGLIAREGL